MSETRSSPTVEFLRFVLLVLMASALLGALGYLPTRNFVGGEAVASMWGALFASAVGSILGALPIYMARAQGSNNPQAALVSMLVRLVAVTLVAALLVLSFGFQVAPFLIWLAVAYLFLLVLDTRYAAIALRGD